MTDCTCSRTCRNDPQRVCQRERLRRATHAKVALTYVTDVQGDWAALYADGVDCLVCQNHSLDLLAVLEALVGKSVTDLAHFEVDSQEGFAAWMGDRGFPHNLSDIPKEARNP